MDRDRQFGEIPCCLSEKKPSVDFFARGFLRPSLLRAFGEGVFVGNDRNILMELENGGWYSGSHRSKTAGVNGIGLIGTAGDQKDLSGLGMACIPMEMACRGTSSSRSKKRVFAAMVLSVRSTW